MRAEELLNPSFELDTTLSKRELVTELAGWEVLQGNVELVDSTIFLAAEGITSLDLNGDQAGAIAQTISGLQSDQDYTLRFAYADQTERKGPIIATAQLWINGQHYTTLRNKSKTPAYIDGVGYLVRPDQEGKLRLEFRSDMQGHYGMVIDNIRLLEGNQVVFPESPAIANPSFEAEIDPEDDPSENPHLHGYQLPGWLVLRENIDLIRIERFGAPDGNSVIDLGGHGAGGIGQIVTDLVPGAYYRLSFFYARHIAWNQVEELSAEIYLNGKLAMQLTRDKTKKAPEWERTAYEFQAPADGRLKLEMYSTSLTVGGGVLFDDLRLERL